MNAATLLYFCGWLPGVIANWRLLKLYRTSAQPLPWTGLVRFQFWAFTVGPLCLIALLVLGAVSGDRQESPARTGAVRAPTTTRTPPPPTATFTPRPTAVPTPRPTAVPPLVINERTLLNQYKAHGQAVEQAYEGRLVQIRGFAGGFFGAAYEMDGRYEYSASISPEGPAPPGYIVSPHWIDDSYVECYFTDDAAVGPLGKNEWGTVRGIVHSYEVDGAGNVTLTMTDCISVGA